MISRLAPASLSPSAGGMVMPAQPGADFAMMFAGFVLPEDGQGPDPESVESANPDVALDAAEVDPALPPSPEALLALIAPMPSTPNLSEPAAPEPERAEAVRMAPEPGAGKSRERKGGNAPVMDVLAVSPAKDAAAPDTPKPSIVPVKDRIVSPAPPAVPGRPDIRALVDAPAPDIVRIEGEIPARDMTADGGLRLAETPDLPTHPPLPPSPAASLTPAPTLTPTLMPARLQGLERLEPAPARDGAPPLPASGQGPAPVMAQTIAPPPAPPPPPVLAQSLAGQLAAALPRMRSVGGETVLTLEPARLGRVTLAWQEGSVGASVLSVRAADPATAALLTRLGDDLTAMLRADPALAGTQGSEFRLDIARAERPAEARVTETRGVDTGAQAQAQDNATGAGHSRHHHRTAHPHDERAQVSAAAAVNVDDNDDGAALRADRADGRARLA